MIDWIKSFIVACLAFVILSVLGVSFAVLIIFLLGINPFIMPIVIIVGILTGLTIIMHGKPQESSK